MLTIIKRVHQEKRKVMLLCRCDCGKTTVVQKGNLVSGHTTSCGHKHFKHGHNRKGHMTRTYCSWQRMKQRTTDVNCRDFKSYGSRGIVIEDPRWFDYTNFLADMGERPDGMTLDRIDNDKGYYKQNCRWASPTLQRANQRFAFRTK